MDQIIIAGGRLRTLGIEHPSNDQIIALSVAAIADGFGLAGNGSVRTVTGSTISIIVGPTGCTCPLWRNGYYCAHMALLAIETATVTIEKRVPTPITSHRERRPSTRQPGRHLWPVRPVTPIRPRTVA